MEVKTNVVVKLVGTDGNVFAIIGKVSKALERGGYPEFAKEYRDKCFNAKSYDEVLQWTLRYVVAE